MANESDFFEKMASPRLCERLFSHLPDVLFCMKDSEHRYRAANPAFAARAGRDSPMKIIGKTAEELFPAELAAVYREQDGQVLRTGQEMVDRLELVTNPDSSLGWYLATKVPLHDPAGNIIGLASISRDLSTPSEEDVKFAGVGRVVSHIQGNLGEDLRATDLAALAGLSPSQLERRMRRVFQLTTSQFIRKARIEHAAHLLTSGTLPVVEIALRCGYGDQTAFTRQFRATVGQPPAAFRERAKKGS